MATTVSYAMRRFPTTSPDVKYSNFSPSDSSTSPASESTPRGALSRSMRYAEPWLYGSVRGTPLLLVQPVPAVCTAVPLCSCADYVCGTARSAKKTSQCKKCKGTRVAINGGKTKYGTVRGYPTSVPTTLTSVRAGTVRVTNSSRATILPPSPTIDPYDLMRRSRLSCPDVGSQFRARSQSPNKSLRNYPNCNKSKNSPRSPSPGKNLISGRKSILECDVNPYDLMSNEGDKKDSKTKNLEPDYEDIEVKKVSQIPKLAKKNKAGTLRLKNEKELIKEAKFKSILKKPSSTFIGPDPSESLKSGSHFYLPFPSLTPPRKKVQFLVENEGDTSQAGVNDRKTDTVILAEADLFSAVLGRDDLGRDDLDRDSAESEASLVPDEDLDNEPCRLRRSLSERLSQGASSITFNDTMALRSPRTRTSVSEGSTLFDAVTDLQRLDGIGPSRPRPREPPPPPPPPSFSPPPPPSPERPATPPPRAATEVEVTIAKEEIFDEKIDSVDVPEVKETDKLPEKVSFEEQKDIVPPSAPPRKRSNSKQPITAQIIKKEPPNEPQNEEKCFPDSSTKDNSDVSYKIEVKTDELIDSSKVTIKSTTDNISSTKIESPEPNYSYQKVKIEPSKTVVQINSPKIIPSTVHRLQIKNEFQDGNYNTVCVSESPQRKTSIMINGNDCYSTVNVNDDVPIYQSSVVVNDYEASSKIEISSGSKSSSVYITGDFQSCTNLSEEPKKTLVMLPDNSSTPSKSFVVLQDEPKQDYEKPSSEELQRLLKDPVEAVKRNLIPHVCGKADTVRKPKSVTPNSLVARLLEDPFLGSLAEGLETNTVAKLIEDSLLKLRSQDIQEDDKDALSEESFPPYELMEAGSDCYSNHSNRSSVTEDELGTRSKFYQLLADAALSEIEDHHYECIKANADPIYEEIEIPPPLPSNPPPSNIIDDLQIDKQFTTRSIFEGASKYDILSYLVDAKERGIVPEEGYTYNFNNSSDVVIEEEDLTKNGVFSSRVSHMSTVSDSSEDSSLVTVEKNPQKSAEVERNDSGVGSETSKCSRSRYLTQQEINITCEDCDLLVEAEDGPLVCKKCSKRRSERKETITEIVETEEKYSRDLQIILEEFYQPMLVAGLLTPEQLSAIFLNVEELLENSQALAERLRDTLEIALEQGDEDLLTVNIGKIFLEAAPMLHAFESYCVRQGPASLLLAGLEKEKELLRIFLRVSQMENTVLRRMNLNSFLMVPVQRVTKYPLLLARLFKVTPLHHESRELLREAQHKIELHLSHMNSETKDVPSKLWRRISNNSGRRSSSEMDLVNIKLRKIAVDVLEWNHDEARFALEGRLLFTQPTDNNWRKGRTIKLTPVNALLVTNGKPNSSSKSDRTSSTSTPPTNGSPPSEDSTALTFPRHTGVREAALLLVRDKGGRYSLLREPLYLDRCVIATDPAWQSYFEVQELLSKDTFIFKAEEAEMTGTWYRQLQHHAQGMGAWRKRRNALANIMINGMGSRS